MKYMLHLPLQENSGILRKKIVDLRFAEKHFHKAPRKSHVIMLKEFMFCPMKIDVVPPSVEFKD
ncbi:hypothetical protein YC2023_061058 [Brassica napus]